MATDSRPRKAEFRVFCNQKKNRRAMVAVWGGGSIVRWPHCINLTELRWPVVACLGILWKMLFEFSGCRVLWPLGCRFGGVQALWKTRAYVSHLRGAFRTSEVQNTPPRIWSCEMHVGGVLNTPPDPPGNVVFCNHSFMVRVNVVASPAFIESLGRDNFSLLKSSFGISVGDTKWGCATATAG